MWANVVLDVCATAVVEFLVGDDRHVHHEVPQDMRGDYVTALM